LVLAHQEFGEKAAIRQGQTSRITTAAKTSFFPQEIHSFLTFFANVIFIHTIPETYSRSVPAFVLEPQEKKSCYENPLSQPVAVKQRGRLFSA